MIYDFSVLVSQTAHNMILFYGILNCVSQKNLQFSPILEINCAEDEISLKFCQKGRWTNLVGKVLVDIGAADSVNLGSCYLDVLIVQVFFPS